MSIDLENAMRLQKRGDFAAAEPLYRAILQADSNHVEANYLLGALLIQSQRIDEALRLLRKVVSLQPNHFLGHHQVGHALRALGDIQSAIEQYRKAVRINPSFVDGLNSLGCALRDTRQYDEAAAAFAKLIDSDPTFAPGYYNLGLVHLERQEMDLAVRRFHDAIDWDTDSFEAYHHLGHAYRKKKDFDQAIAYYNKALQMRPTDARVVTDIGVIFQLKQDFSEARRWYERALALNSELPEALCNMGTLCQACGSYDEAMKYYEHALGIHPDYVECLIAISDTYQKLAREKEALASAEYAMYLAPDRFRVRLCFAKALLWNTRFDEAENQLEWCLSKHAHHVDALIHMGLLNVERGRPELALQWFNRVIDGNPRDTAARRLRGGVLLALGRLEQGWQELDREGVSVEYPLPMAALSANWKGEDLYEKTLIVYFDCALSDSLLLASCLPDLLHKTQQCEISCDAALVSIFERSFPRIPVSNMTSPINSPERQRAIGYHCTASSMPRYLRKQMEAFPAHNAYLVADAERVQQWRQKLRELGPGLTIGLAWQGGRMSVTRGLHEVCLDDFGEILARRSATFVALVGGEGDADVAELEQRYGVVIHRFDGVMKKEGIEDLFALVAALDRLVTTNVLPLHVAGSLGKSAWMLSRPHRDWLNLGTDEIPWYPSVRRVTKIGRDEWTISMGKLADELYTGASAPVPKSEQCEVSGAGLLVEMGGQASMNDITSVTPPLRNDSVEPDSLDWSASAAKAASKTLFTLALEHYQRDDLPGAEEYCHLGLEDQPNDVNLLSLLAKVFVETERGAVALALLEKAHMLRPSDSALCIQLSRVYALLGLDAQRIEMLVNLCRREVESGEAHLELAHALERAGKLDAAAVAAQLASLLLLEKSEARAMLVRMGFNDAANRGANIDNVMNLDGSSNSARSNACTNVDSFHLLTWKGALTAALTHAQTETQAVDGVTDPRK